MADLYSFVYDTKTKEETQHLYTMTYVFNTLEDYNKIVELVTEFGDFKHETILDEKNLQKILKFSTSISYDNNLVKTDENYIEKYIEVKTTSTYIIKINIIKF